MGVEVSVNGRRLYLASGGPGGSATVFITAEQFDTASPPANLSVSGSRPRAGGDTEYLHWPAMDLKVGDEVTVRVVDGPPDPPAKRQVYETESQLDGYRQQLRDACGWLTDDERRALIRELLAELQGPAAPGAAADRAGRS